MHSAVGLSKAKRFGRAAWLSWSILAVMHGAVAQVKLFGICCMAARLATATAGLHSTLDSRPAAWGILNGSGAGQS